MKFGKGPQCEQKSLRNCAALCMLFLVALLLYHDPFLLLRWPHKHAEPGRFPLDMATHSIDDMYDGCRVEKASMIDLFGVFEWHVNVRFSHAWALSEKTAKKPVHRDLKEEHAIVLNMYTKDKYIQYGIDRAVRTGKRWYNTGRFPFHYFYFYLTDAIQVLRRSQLTACRTTYHRTQRPFSRNVNNTNVRFGAFTWAASSKHSLDFNGNVSCFEIHSCFGADITYYSAEKHIAQLLIPPYEVFKITDVLTDDPWCSVVYRLKSTMVPRSDLNCELNERQMKRYFGDVVTSWPVSVVWTLSASLMLLVIASLVLIRRRQKRFVAAVLSALLGLIIVALMLS